MKQLISPVFRITLGDVELTNGFEVECYSSKETHTNWCKIELDSELEGVLAVNNMDAAVLELGYEDDFERLLEGYIRINPADYWKEIIIKDDMMKLEQTEIKETFIDCTPQDIIKYILTSAGIENYLLSDTTYGKKNVFVIDRKNGLKAIVEVNNAWGIPNSFYFQEKTFRWGTNKDQTEIYVLEEDETIMSLEKYGSLWEAETLAVPWIHHSQKVEVIHSKFSGTVEVEKTIIKNDDTGMVRMYIYFAGGNGNV